MVFCRSPVHLFIASLIYGFEIVCIIVCCLQYMLGYWGVYVYTHVCFVSMCLI